MVDPKKFRRQSLEAQAQLGKDCAPPVGAYWMEPRWERVQVETSVIVNSVEAGGDHLHLS